MKKVYSAVFDFDILLALKDGDGVNTFVIDNTVLSITIHSLT